MIDARLIEGLAGVIVAGGRLQEQRQQLRARGRQTRASQPHNRRQAAC